jgi:cytochrome c oxidase cbb3-type subunit III
MWRVLIAVSLLIIIAAGFMRLRTEMAYRPSQAAEAARGERIVMTTVAVGSGAAQRGGNTHEELSGADVNEGKRLYKWFNCNGCHANGGGDVGPALMDDKWIYGADAANIFQTIMEGRPNGMPSFRDKIPAQQAWQIVAYVRSMSGLVPFYARPGRSDALQSKTPEIMTPYQPPRQTEHLGRPNE